MICIVTNAEGDLFYRINWFVSALISVLRLGAGRSNAKIPAQPDVPLELFEYEACPFCRKVREAVSGFGLNVIVKPCPKGGRTYRPQVVAMGGKAQFPYLVDPNRGVSLYESHDIIRYLRKHYAKSRTPILHKVPIVNELLGSIASLLRIHRGHFSSQPARSEQPDLVFHQLESSPASRLVREKLCELELPYLAINLPQLGDAPRLIDESRGKTIEGAWEICQHLHTHYDSQTQRAGAN